MQGLVIKAISGEYTIFNDGRLLVCKPKGLFRLREELVKVGDRVVVDEKTKTIIAVLPRKNELIRPAVANLDKIFLVFSVKEPELNLNLLDRLLSIFEYYDLHPIIVFTKVDLLENQEEFLKVSHYYHQIGYTTYSTGRGLSFDLIKQEISGSICAFAGQSGVGKSTLLNCFDDSFQIKTDAISQALGRGKHTTRHVELLKLGDGWVADTPGFGTIEFPNIDMLTFSQTFREFFEARKDCQFKKCLHVDEPDCAIKKMVKDGNILSSRYDNYLLFYKEIKENLKNQY
jgi:ribosome biogenesis GTPase